MKTNLKAAVYSLSSLLVAGDAIRQTAALVDPEQKDGSQNGNQKVASQSSFSDGSASERIRENNAPGREDRTDKNGDSPNQKQLEGAAVQADSNDVAEGLGSLTHYADGGPSHSLPAGSGASFQGDNVASYKVARRVRTRARASRSRINVKNSKQDAHRRKARSDNDSIGLTENGCFRGPQPLVEKFCIAAQCCQGTNACDWPSDQIATVCPFACNGDRACQDLGEGSYIGWKACQGYEVCLRLGANSDIGFKSCYGRYACLDLAKSGSASVGKQACVGDYACPEICEYAPNCEVVIENYACQGDYSCGYVADRSTTAKKVTVGQGSCNAKKSVKGQGACSFVGRNSVSIEVGDYSCLDTRACNDLGGDTPKKVEVGDDSCDGVYSCEYLGSNSLEDVKVGDEACLGDEACYSLGYNTLNKVTVEDESCTAQGACEYFGYNFGDSMPSADIKISKAECTSMNECSGVVITGCQNTAKVPNKDGICPAST